MCIGYRCFFKKFQIIVFMNRYQILGMVAELNSNIKKKYYFYKKEFNKTWQKKIARKMQS
ncbi:hypothetical protein GCM10009433_05220 [Psychroflexus lacisalsi]|uniref:Uncharacterized protein n=1 Tax=Psychroflexus lacisalsi TaxID=503928 RepID=A0ABN1K2Y7_9FLAO